MSYAPPTLRDLGAYLTAHGVENLGIVGDTAHTYGYHLGRDRIYGPNGRGDADYSVQLARDKAGLTDAASAIDLGDAATSLRALTRWLWDQCLAGAPDTADIREVIGSADGVTVYGWSSKSPGQLILNYGDSSHLWHTHVAWLRDSEVRDKRPLFGRYFDTPPDTGTGGDMDITEYLPGYRLVVRGNADIYAGTVVSHGAITRTVPAGGSESWDIVGKVGNAIVWWSAGSGRWECIEDNGWDAVSLTPPASGADCTAQIEAAIAADRAKARVAVVWE